MVMQMLSAGGTEVEWDGSRMADSDNPKGYFELERVKELEKSGDMSWLRQYKGKVIKIVSFLLPYLPFDLNYRVIFISRSLNEVLLSKNRMLIRHGKQTDSQTDQQMKEHYERHLRKVRYLESTKTSS